MGFWKLNAALPTRIHDYFTPDETVSAHDHSVKPLSQSIRDLLIVKHANLLCPDSIMS
jgi:hypothetical protein